MAGKFTTLNSTKITAKGIDRFLTIDKVRKVGTKQVFFAVRDEKGRNIVPTMFARKYHAEELSRKLFQFLRNKKAKTINGNKEGIKRDGTLKKGYRYAKGGKVVKAKKK